MRKELGTPARALFSRRLREVAPDFEPRPEYGLPGFTWPFIRVSAPVMQCIWYQQHKRNDSFTLELSWSQRAQDPATVRLGGPQDSFQPEGCRFRLGAFWQSGGDFWWAVADGLPDLLTTPTSDFLRVLENPSPVDLDAPMPRISQAVQDAVDRVQEFALPYFDRVLEWALR